MELRQHRQDLLGQAPQAGGGGEAEGVGVLDVAVLGLAAERRHASEGSPRVQTAAKDAPRVADRRRNAQHLAGSRMALELDRRIAAPQVPWIVRLAKVKGIRGRDGMGRPRGSTRDHELARHQRRIPRHRPGEGLHDEVLLRGALDESEVVFFDRHGVTGRQRDLVTAAHGTATAFATSHQAEKCVSRIRGSVSHGTAVGYRRLLPFGRAGAAQTVLNARAP